MIQRVWFVAAPLTARSGVYRSTIELVGEARRSGLPWSALLGVSRHAPGDAAPHPSWIVEQRLEPAGLGGIRRLRAALAAAPMSSHADVVVSMTPQTDMALATMRQPWVAYLRGLPWPGRGESTDVRRQVWRRCEVAALRRADEVWATTSTLRDQVVMRRDIELVPAGIEPVPRRTDGGRAGTRLVWAARFDHDKRPGHFVDLVRDLEVRGVMYGAGPLRDRCAAEAPPGLTVAGWARPEELWFDALAYVGTSRREAFGRSAVEAAMTGVPVVLSDAFGVGPLLYTDDALASRFVLPLDDVAAWRRAVRDLQHDSGLRRAVSDHVHANASLLTVDASVRRIAARIADLDGARRVTGAVVG